MFERTSQSPSVNEDLVKNNNTTTNTDNYAMTSLRQHRLTPPTFARTNTVNTATKKQPGIDKPGGKRAKAKAVKMWIMKGMVQVRNNALHHASKGLISILHFTHS